MKVLEVNLERGWRGGERQTLFTAEALARQGVAVTVLARQGQPLAQAAREAGVAVAEVQGSAAAWRWLWRQGAGFHIIHAQTAHALTACVFSAWGHGRPVVATRRVAFALKGAASRFKYARADALVAISDAAAAPLEAMGLGPVLRIPSAVQAAPVAAAEVAALRERWVAPGKAVLGTVAALSAEKDPFTLVAAVARLAAQRQDFVFLHLGSGALQAEVTQAIERAGLQSVYRLVGFQPAVAPWYAVFDGFVMSSRSEGLGSSVLDAMLRGVPVASTLAGGLAEVVADNRGLGVPAGDAPALAHAMNALLDTAPAARAARAERAERALAWVQQQCSVGTMAQRYRVLFESLLSQGKLS